MTPSSWSPHDDRLAETPGGVGADHRRIAWSRPVARPALGGRRTPRECRRLATDRSRGAQYRGPAAVGRPIRGPARGRGTSGTHPAARADDRAGKYDQQPDAWLGRRAAPAVSPEAAPRGRLHVRG